MLTLERCSKHLVSTHLCQKFQNGSFSLCEHVNQGLNEARAFLVVSVGDVPWGILERWAWGGAKELEGTLEECGFCRLDLGICSGG
jgi:hypothetical protein